MRLYRIIYKYLPLFILRLFTCSDVVKLKQVGKDPTSHHAPCVVFVGVLIPGRFHRWWWKCESDLGSVSTGYSDRPWPASKQ